MITNQIIEPSRSEYASPIVIKRNKNGQPRFLIDYRHLNTQTRDSPTPLPIIIKKTLRDLSHAKAIFTIDLRLGCWKISRPTQDRTILVSKAPRRDLNASQRKNSFRGIHKFILIYLDDRYRDILTGSQNPSSTFEMGPGQKTLNSKIALQSAKVQGW